MPALPAKLLKTGLRPAQTASQAGFAYYPDWLSINQADQLLSDLLAEVDWQQHRVQLFGQWHDCPRLSAWYGDAGANYAYSGQALEPSAWTPRLAALRDHLHADIGLRFNSVLLNRYRDGNDAMGWHSDNERSLGPEPLIASVSLGAVRKFSLRSKATPRQYHHLALDSGSLLLLGGRCQHDWQHQLPRSKRVSDERLNLTFRYIHASGG
jgi:alkylated DNA repair dioxygenase AlkB